VHVLDESSMRFIVPETQAVLCGMMNSKPSLETKVTNSGVDELTDMFCRSIGFRLNAGLRKFTVET
jgi:hypothetical protein